MRSALSLIGPFLLACCVGSETGSSGGPESAPAEDPEAWGGDVAEAAQMLRPREGTDVDWRILEEKATWAWGEGLDSIPIGESISRIGLSFVGTRYTPRTLELTGSEDLVVNLEEFDCVTFVENVLALALFIRSAEPDVLSSMAETQALYRRILTQIRYRAGRIDGYPSRLHYFTDWILDNQEKGLVREMTQDLGGVEDFRAVDFMSTHPDSYRQLANPQNLRAVQEREFYLSGLTRYRIPEEEISTWGAWIQNGDIIAATSTVDGLDVAHTGLAVWQDENLHLLHAPLVGESVELSTIPLADRILRLEGQDGIKVARPLDPGTGSL